METTVRSRIAVVWLAGGILWLFLLHVLLAPGPTRFLAELAWLAGGFCLLLLSRRRLRSVWTRPEGMPQSTGSGVWAVDVDQRTTYVNERMAAMLGYEPREMLGRSLFEFMDEAGEKIAREGLERQRQGQTEGLEFCFLGRDERQVWTFLTARPIQDQEGDYVGAVAVVTELTRLPEKARDADRSREVAQARLLEAAETIREVLWVSDPDYSRIQYVSDRYETVFGRSVESLEADPLSFLDAVHPDDRARVRKALGDLASGDYDVEYRIVRPDGEERWIWARGVPVTNESGDVIRISGIAEDITDKKRLEEEFRQSQKMEAVGRLAGGVAHDFNNLLTVVNGYSEMLLQTLDEEDPKRPVVSEIRNAGERATNLTRQLLAFGRRQVLRPQKVDVSSIVEEIRPMLSRLIGEDVVLNVRTRAGLEPVHADPTQIEQVILNLVVNARDAMPSGGRLTIETARVEVDADYAARHSGLSQGPHIVLAVSDTGTGMDEATVAKVFEPFFTTKAKGVGTGLGLSTVYGIVRQTGGHVWLYSEPGLGTTFKVLLPAVGGPPEDRRSEPDYAPERGGSETILLVEDDEAVRRFATEILRSAGYTVLGARGPGEAIVTSDRREAGIDLLLTDVVMPEVGGPQLAEKLGAKRPEMRILYMSGYADTAIVHHGVLREGTAFLAKPFVPRQLLAMVRRVLDEPRA